MKTIVSVTPLRVQEDSRTFKEAASFARFGYRSIVVEGQPSRLDRERLPFELISAGHGSGDRSSRGAQYEGECAGSSRVRAVFRAMLVAVGQGATRLVRRLYQFSARVPLLQPLLMAVVRFPMFLLYFMWRHLLVPLRHAPKASLYYLHSPIDFPAVYVVSRRYRVPYIYDAHDFYPEIEGTAGIPTLGAFDCRWVAPFLFKLERMCIRKAAAVVTVCDGVAGLQEAAFGCHSIVVRNCHDNRLDRRPGVDLRQSLGLSGTDFLVVTIGRAKPGQAIEEALEAMGKLPNHVHLAFVGGNTDHHVELVRRKKLEGRVHLVPPVKPFEVVPFVDSADASLILYYGRSPNYLNCLPNGLFQAIGAGLPLLYPKLPEITRIGREYDLGIPIDPRDPESIAMGVRQLMTDREKLLTYHRNASLARDRLSWEREERILADLVSRALEKRQRTE